MADYQNWVTDQSGDRTPNQEPGVDFELLNRTVTDAILLYGPTSKDRFLDRVLDMAVWMWTQRTGKFNTGFVTRAALQQRRDNRATPGRWLHQDLQHEHVVTKAHLKTLMRQAGNASPLADAVACIVTKNEHRSMKSKAEGWQRYVDAGILDVLTEGSEVPVDVAALAAAQQAAQRS